nr:uncharacterized protein LOC123773088 [Procambarus clarkii]
MEPLPTIPREGHAKTPYEQQSDVTSIPGQQQQGAWDMILLHQQETHHESWDQTPLKLHRKQRESWDLSPVQHGSWDLSPIQHGSWDLSPQQDEHHASKHRSPLQYKRQSPWYLKPMKINPDSTSSSKLKSWDVSRMEVLPSPAQLLQGPTSVPSGPFFLEAPDSQVSVRAGQAASLTCVVKHLGNRQVSWIRGGDLHVLSSGVVTFSSDSRVEVRQEGEAWTLTIKYTQLSDAGAYSCQVNTQPRLASWYNLTVIEARAAIMGKETLYVQAGSTVMLECIITEQLLIPGLVLWYLDDRLVQRDAGRVTVVTLVDNVTSSTLTVMQATHQDSGNYSCWPSAGRPDSVTVHVIQGDPPAAMQHGNFAPAPFVSPLLLLLLLLLLHPNTTSCFIDT